MKLQIVIASLISAFSLPTWADDCGDFQVSTKNEITRLNAVNYVEHYAKATAEKRSTIDDNASITLGNALEKYEHIPRKSACRSDAWKTLIALVIATSPYDKESAGVNFIAKQLKDPKLNSEYLEIIQKTGDSCRRKFVAAMVTESTCMMQNKRNPKAPEICIPKDSQAKDVDTCLSSSQKADKSRSLEDFQGSSVTAAQL